jgi:hypothetical protein
MVVLQNCMDLLQGVPGSDSETCPMPSHDGNQVICMKVDVTDTQEEEDPLLITFTAIKDEHGVSCMFMCVL